MAEPGQMLESRYRLDARIAAGGMGEVWRGTDLALSRAVAVKLLHPEHASQPDGLARFRTEAQHAGSLTHPNIAQVYDYCDPVPPDPAYLVLELVDGPSLARHLDGGPLSPADTLDVIEQVASGLAAAHRAGLLHRDIKPGNLLLSQDGLIKITDFGIARAAGSAVHTRTGALTGTPAYLAPERFGGAPATPATDLYALGVVAYKCLTGQLPFSGDPLVVALAHVERDMPPLPGSVPADLAALIADLTRKDPRDRPASAIAVLARASLIRPAVSGPANNPAYTGGSPAGTSFAGTSADDGSEAGYTPVMNSPDGPSTDGDIAAWDAPGWDAAAWDAAAVNAASLADPAGTSRAGISPTATGRTGTGLAGTRADGTSATRTSFAGTSAVAEAAAAASSVAGPEARTGTSALAGTEAGTGPGAGTGAAAGHFAAGGVPWSAAPGRHAPGRRRPGRSFLVLAGLATAGLAGVVIWLLASGPGSGPAGHNSPTRVPAAHQASPRHSAHPHQGAAAQHGQAGQRGHRGAGHAAATHRRQHGRGRASTQPSATGTSSTASTAPTPSPPAASPTPSAPAATPSATVSGNGGTPSAGLALGAGL